MRVETELDARRARQAVEQLAYRHGVTSRAIGELQIVVMELAANLARYAKAGTLTFTVRRDASGAIEVMEVASRDRGPGIADLDEAFRDGFTTGRGLGKGLGAVRRMSSDVRVTTSTEGPSQGTEIVAEVPLRGRRQTR